MPRLSIGTAAACRSEELRRYVRELVEPRMRIQMRGGVLPSEMWRPTSQFYINYAAEGLVRLASLLQLEGFDYWHWDADKGASVLVCARCQGARPVTKLSPGLKCVHNMLHAVLHRASVSAAVM